MSENDSSDSDSSDVESVSVGKKRAAIKGRKKKDADAPKRAQTGYIFFGKEMQAKIREELKAKNPEVKQKEIMSEVARRWRTLSETEKQPFIDMAKTDKERYEKEMAAYKQKKGSDSDDSSDDDLAPKRKRQKGNKKDPNAPKLPRSGYLLFCEATRDKVRATLQGPNFKTTDVMTEIGRQWKALSSTEKDTWAVKAKEDKIRYEKRERGIRQFTQVIANNYAWKY